MATQRKSATSRKRPAERVRKLARARAVAAACHRAMVRAPDELALLREICRVAAREGGYALAWAGLVRHDEACTLEVVAGASRGKQYFRVPHIPMSWADNALGRGPSGRAVRTRKPQIVRDVAADPDFAPWHDTVTKLGFASAAAFPLICDDEVIGVFGIFGAKRQTLDRDEKQLLMELAADIAYGYRSLQSRRAQLQAEQHLRKQVRARRVMSECSRVLNDAEDEQHIYDEVCRILTGPGGYDAAWVGLVEHDEAKSIKPAAHAGFPGGFFAGVSISWDERGSRGQGPAGRAVRSGCSQLERNVDVKRAGAHWRVALPGSERASALLVPLKERGRVVAVLGVFIGEEDPFDEDELMLLEQLAGDIAHARDTLLAREVQRAAEARVAQSERRFYATFDLAPVGINHIAPDGQILLANSHFEHMLGYERGALAGRNVRELHFNDEAGRQSLKRLNALRAQLYGGAIDKFTSEVQYRRRDGSPMWVELTVTLLRDDDGKPLYDLSTVVDVSERKRTEVELRSSEQRFRAMTLLASEWYWETDEQYRVTVLENQTFDAERMNAIARQSLGKTHWDVPAMNMTEADWAAHRRRLDARETFQDLVLKRAARLSSAPLYLSISGEPVFDAEGRFVGYRGIAKDISERMRVEQLQHLEHAVSAALGRADSAEEGLREVLRTFCEIDAWECGRFFERPDGREELRFVTGWSVADPAIAYFVERSRAITFRRGEGLAGKAWEADAPLWAFDIERDGRMQYAGLAADTGIHGAFVFPVRADGVILGAISLSSRRPREPDQRVLRAVSSIGSQVGQFLQRKQAEERARSQALQQRAIADFGRMALANVDLADILRQAVDCITQTLGVEYCDVLELDPDGRRLTYRAAAGRPQEWIGQRQVEVSERSQVAFVLAHKEPVIVEDYRSEARFAPSTLLALGIASGVQVPIHGPASLFGLLGVQSASLRRFTEDEVSFLDSMANILAVAIDRKGAEDRLAFLAQFDALTGLPNRHLFHDRLVQAMAQVKRAGNSMAVLFIDLDRFKLVNDTLGHAVGDKLLKEAASRLQRCVRSSDTVGRLGGDEFSAILLDLAQPGDASIVAQKMIEALGAPFQLEGHETYVSGSIGITLFPDDGDAAATLIMNADAAMYRAKEQGRNNFQYFTREMNERALHRVSLEAQLRRALERNEFTLQYQPRVNLTTGAICGFEALLRWAHPERGVIAPAEFIPVLEDTGLIAPVGEWVIRCVCEQLLRWVNDGIPVRPVAVNLSPRQFQQKDLESSVRRLLAESGADPSLLQFEITETLLMKDPEAAARVLHGLNESGVKLSVDDFGTGYSSLAYLKRFPLDALKIDRAFIRDIASDPEDAAITLAIINLAHSLGLQVIAEGVENEAQLDFLTSHGCDEMQGFYFSPAVNPAQCEAMLRSGMRLERVGRPDGVLRVA